MGKSDQGVVTLWAAAHYFKRPLRYIGFGGTGKQVRDIVHIDDVCDLVADQVARFDSYAGRLFNTGGGLRHSVSLRELTAACEKVTGNRIAIAPEAENRRADVRIYLTDHRRLTEATGWASRGQRHSWRSHTTCFPSSGSSGTDITSSGTSSAWPLSLAAGLYAARLRRSAVGWMLFSLALSPLVGFVFLAALGTKARGRLDRVPCPFCSEPVRMNGKTKSWRAAHCNAAGASPRVEISSSGKADCRRRSWSSTVTR